nr:zinc finger, CCHC-type [Tanacetum cinerariifolium]
NENLETTRKRMKWENDDYICRGHILNGMSDSLFDIYQNIGSAKELWESLESKYMTEDASSKKFLVSNFMNYKMVDTIPVMEQFHEMLRILRQMMTLLGGLIRVLHVMFARIFVGFKFVNRLKMDHV